MGPTLTLVFDSSRFFAAFDFIDFTAGFTGAIVDEVIDFSRFSVDQIFLVGICCTHIFTISLGAIILKTIPVMLQFEQGQGLMIHVSPMFSS